MAHLQPTCELIGLVVQHALACTCVWLSLVPVCGIDWPHPGPPLVLAQMLMGGAALPDMNCPQSLLLCPPVGAAT